MGILQNLLFTICIALRCMTSAEGVIHVTGYVGSEVNISCSYGQGYESYEKYLYAGKYWCGVTRTGTDIYTEVMLKLVQDSCCDTVTKIESYEGYSESVSCPYESQYQNNLKYICRGNRPSACLQEALITSDTKQNGRFRLDDDKVLFTVNGTFTVNMSSLTHNDSGSYLCGVQRNSDLDVFSAVELKVKEWCCVKSIKIKGTVGQPLTLQCPYPPQHLDKGKFLCKGEHRTNCKDITSQSRFKLEGNGSSSSFSVVITKLEEADAGTYWCGSDSERRPGNYTKIQLSVDAGQYVVYAVPAVLLLLICVLVVAVYQCKHQKVKDGKAVMNRNAENEEGLEEVTAGAENNIYGNEEVVRYKQQSACNNYDDVGEDEPDYENFTTSEEVYCNENFHRR
ncbi:polymeric immunoglobulin receptor-like isoform X4 [Oreochromis aureus]|uniref:polymeric immunoglobulin receptor-like isoform X4 n=1 Tax=Oreochromis aureus TaxID=47969 RepID=UPI001954456E|nr:polymeric immunoglobulin receptor-like isoform X4 [Oreochromis aureus]